MIFPKEKILIIFIGLLLLTLFVFTFKGLFVFKKGSPPSTSKNMELSKSVNNEKKVLMVVAFRDFRDEELFTPKQVLENEGIEVKLASDQKGIAIGADGGEANIDYLISEVNIDDFSAIIFVGGPGCLSHLDNEQSYHLLKEAKEKDKIIAAICISPVILAKAGILEGKRATVWSSPLEKTPINILKENGAIYEEEMVVVNEKIITANGPAAAKEFGKTILEILKK